MLKVGRLYVFEGCDGAGKTTLAKKFCEAISKGGQVASYIAFPGHSDRSLGKHVYLLHHNPKSVGLEEIHAPSLQVLHIAAHIENIEKEILPALKRGEWVILDRYWWSTWVYGISSGVDRKALKIMVELELSFWQKISPSALFYIERIATQVQHQNKKLLSEYQALVKRESNRSRVYTINNDRPLNVVMDDLLSRVRSI